MAPGSVDVRVIASADGHAFEWDRNHGLEQAWVRCDAARRGTDPLTVHVDDVGPRWSSPASGVLVHANRHRPEIVSVLVAFAAGADAEPIQLSLPFHLDPRDRDRVFASKKRNPVHRRVVGYLSCDDHGRLRFRPEELGAADPKTVFETLEAVVRREDRGEAIRRWADAALWTALRWHWVSVASCHVTGRRDTLWVENPPPGAARLVRHVMLCEDIDAGRACRVCASLIRDAPDGGPCWAKLLLELRRRTGTAPVPAAPSDAPPVALGELVEAVGAILDGQRGAAARRAAIERIRTADAAAIRAAIRTLYETYQVSRGGVSGPWCALLWARAGFGHAPPIDDEIITHGWPGRAALFPLVTRRVYDQTLADGERLLAVLALWECAPQHRHELYPDLIRTALALATALEADGIHVKIALVRNLVEGAASWRPETAQRQPDRVIAGYWDCLAALPPSPRARVVWLTAYTDLPWLRAAIAREAPRIDPSPLLARVLATPEVPPDAEELQRAADATDGDEPRAAATLLIDWFWLAAAAGAAPPHLPVLPRGRPDGTVAGSVDYWRAFLRGCRHVPPGAAPAMWGRFEPEIRARVTDVAGEDAPDDLENRVWLSCRAYLERTGAPADAAMSELMEARIRTLVGGELRASEPRPVTISSALVLAAPADRFVACWTLAEARYRSADQRGLRQRFFTHVEERRDVAALMQRPEIHDALCDGLATGMPYLVVGALRCWLAAAGLRHTAGWLVETRNHRSFWNEVAPVVARTWRLDRDPATGTWRTHCAALLGQVALGELGPATFLITDNRTMALRSLESVDGDAALAVARRLYRRGAPDVVARALASRVQLDETAATLLGEAIDALDETPTEALTRFVIAAGDLGRRGWRVEPANWRRMADLLARRLAAEPGDLGPAQCLGALATLPAAIRAGTDEIAVDVAIGLLARLPDDSTARRELGRYLGAVGQPLEAGAETSDATATIEEVVTDLLAALRVAAPSPAFARIAQGLAGGRRSAADVVAERLALVGSRVRTPLARVTAGLGTFVRAAVRLDDDHAIRDDSIDLAAHRLARLRTGAVHDALLHAADAADLPSTAFAQVSSRGVNPAVRDALCRWTDADVDRLATVSRGFAIQRLSTSLSTAEAILHDMKAIAALDEVRAIVDDLGAEIARVQDPPVQRVEAPAALVHDILDRWVAAADLRAGTLVINRPDDVRGRATRLSIRDLDAMLGNLASNAVRHGRAPVEVTIGPSAVVIANHLPTGHALSAQWAADLMDYVNWRGHDLSPRARGGLLSLRRALDRNPYLDIKAELAADQLAIRVSWKDEK